MGYSHTASAFPAPYPIVRTQTEMFGGTATAVGTSRFLPQDTLSDITVIIDGLSGETVQIQYSFNGGTNWQSAALLPINASTGNPVTSAALVNGTYVIPFKKHSDINMIRFVKSASANTVRVCYSVAIPDAP